MWFSFVITANNLYIVKNLPLSVYCPICFNKNIFLITIKLASGEITVKCLSHRLGDRSSMPSTHYAWNGGRNLWHWRGRHSEILGGSLASFSPIRDPALKTNSTCSQFQSALYLPSPDHSSGLRAWPDHVPQHWLLCWRLSLNPSAIPSALLQPHCRSFFRDDLHDIKNDFQIWRVVCRRICFNLHFMQQFPNL